jgi:hypothetical protein
LKGEQLAFFASARARYPVTGINKQDLCHSSIYGFSREKKAYTVKM